MRILFPFRKRICFPLVKMAKYVNRFEPDKEADAEAILWDKQDPALIYVISNKGKEIKIVTRVNYRLKGSPEPVNIIATAGKIQKSDLMDKRYEIIRGKL